jgi:hypothetical protein
MSNPPVTPPPSTSASGEPLALEDVYHNVESLDNLPPDQLADILNQLAEKIVTAPEEYKIGFGLTSLDAALLDGIDLSTAEGRKKLAAILRMLAQLVMSREKNAYLSATSALTIDGGKDKGRGR